VASTLDGIVQRINPATFAVEARIPVSMPTAISIGPDTVWVTSELGDTLTRIDTATNTATNFPVGDGPRGIAVTEDTVWVALGPPGQVVQVDRATGVVLGTLKVDGFADALAIDESKRVWVSVRTP
jgi:YVTN family beta-propeller protein